MRRIVDSTYASLDGVIQDPQGWPGNGIEPDGPASRCRPTCSSPTTPYYTTLYAALRHWIEKAFPFTKAYYSNIEIPDLTG